MNKGAQNLFKMNQVGKQIELKRKKSNFRKIREMSFLNKKKGKQEVGSKVGIWKKMKNLIISKTRNKLSN